MIPSIRMLIFTTLIWFVSITANASGYRVFFSNPYMIPDSEEEVVVGYITPDFRASRGSRQLFASLKAFTEEVVKKIDHLKMQKDIFEQSTFALEMVDQQIHADKKEKKIYLTFNARTRKLSLVYDGRKNIKLNKQFKSIEKVVDGIGAWVDKLSTISAKLLFTNHQQFDFKGNPDIESWELQELDSKLYLQDAEILKVKIEAEIESKINLEEELSFSPEGKEAYLRLSNNQFGYFKDLNGNPSFSQFKLPNNEMIEEFNSLGAIGLGHFPMTDWFTDLNQNGQVIAYNTVTGATQLFEKPEQLEYRVNSNGRTILDKFWSHNDQVTYLFKPDEIEEDDQLILLTHQAGNSEIRQIEINYEYRGNEEEVPARYLDFKKLSWNNSNKDELFFLSENHIFSLDIEGKTVRRKHLELSYVVTEDHEVLWNSEDGEVFVVMENIGNNRSNLMLSSMDDGVLFEVKNQQRENGEEWIVFEYPRNLPKNQILIIPESDIEIRIHKKIEFQTSKKDESDAEPEDESEKAEPAMSLYLAGIKGGKKLKSNRRDLVIVTQNLESESTTIRVLSNSNI